MGPSFNTLDEVIFINIIFKILEITNFINWVSKRLRSWWRSCSIHRACIIRQRI